VFCTLQIIFVKLYYWNHSGDRGPQILAAMATCGPPGACWVALLEANAGGLHQIRPRSLPFAYLPVYLLLFFLQFDAVISHLLTASFNKLLTNKNGTCIEGRTCSTSRPNLLYVTVDFLKTLSVVFPSVEGLTYTNDVRERFF